MTCFASPLVKLIICRCGEGLRGGGGADLERMAHSHSYVSKTYAPVDLEKWL
jgi:hypothetical protein